MFSVNGISVSVNKYVNLRSLDPQTLIVQGSVFKLGQYRCCCSDLDSIRVSVQTWKIKGFMLSMGYLMTWSA
jgi:hypothetical protein